MRYTLLLSALLLSACSQAQPTPTPDDLVAEATPTPELVNAPTPTAEPTPTTTPEPTPDPGTVLVHGMEPEIAGAWIRQGTWEDGTSWTDTWIFNSETTDSGWGTADFRFERRWGGEVVAVMVGGSWTIHQPGELTAYGVQDPEDPNDERQTLILPNCLLYRSLDQLMCDSFGTQPATRL